MVQISSILHAAVEATFKAFNEAVHSANYDASLDNGFDDALENTVPARLIMDKFSQEDIRLLSYSDDIQPSDIKGLIPGIDLRTVNVASGNTVTVTNQVTNLPEKYSVVAFDTDAYKALYIILLRSG